MKYARQWAGIVAGSVLSALFSLTSQAQQPKLDPSKVEAGENVYSTYCAPCHGDGLVSTGQFPNLKRLTPSDRAKFDSTVREGRNQMPPWRDVLTDEQIDQIWTYIRSVVDQ